MASINRCIGVMKVQLLNYLNVELGYKNSESLQQKFVGVRFSSLFRYIKQLTTNSTNSKRTLGFIILSLIYIKFIMSNNVSYLKIVLNDII